MTGFFKLFSVWRGSVIKLIYHNMLIFLLLYYTLQFLYRYVFMEDPYQKEVFEVICIYVGRNMDKIPLTFLIGFYVQQVVSRWWSMFTVLPYPDRIALKLISYCPGKGHFQKNLRRTVMRYVNLSTILVYRLVSKKVKDRFPDFDSLVSSKLLLPHEAERLERVDFRTPHEATWTPILWALKLVAKARTRGEVTLEPPVYANFVTTLEYIEDCNRKILNYGWVEFPLAYTQVATFSVYAYFFAALFGRQFLVPGSGNKDDNTFPTIGVDFSTSEPFNTHTPNVFVPFFTLIEFISYMGWIKVAETLLNPFGDDDEDFDINYLIDRNLQVSYLIVDLADTDLEMANDPFLEAGISVPEELPYQTIPSSRNSSIRSIVKKKHSVSLVSIRNAMASAENGEFSITPTPEQSRKMDLMRQNSAASIINSARLDDLVEVDNEQETVRSMSELKKKLEDISRKPSATGVDNPCFDDAEDFNPKSRDLN